MAAEPEHRRIQDDEVIERYVLGTLAPEERDAFEEHLVGCADCAAQVLWTTDFRAALVRDAALRAATSGGTVAARPAPPDPVVNVPSLQLESVRGEAPAQQIALAPDAPWLLLSLELELEPRATYSARLTTRAGVPVWAGSGLRPVSPSLLSTLLPTRLLVEGEYVVAIENANAPAGSAPLGRYSFRLTRPRQQ